MIIIFSNGALNSLVINNRTLYVVSARSFARRIRFLGFGCALIFRLVGSIGSFRIVCVGACFRSIRWLSHISLLSIRSYNTFILCVDKTDFVETSKF